MTKTAARTREQALEELVDALDAMLAHYRIGTYPGDELLDRVGRLRAELGR